MRLQKTEYALVSSLQRDPLWAERIKRLRTVPGVGPITALTWALEVGDVTRFRSIKQAISAVREAVRLIPRSDLPDFLAELERVRAQAMLATPASAPEDHHGRCSQIRRPVRRIDRGAAPVLRSQANNGVA